MYLSSLFEYFGDLMSLLAQCHPTEYRSNQIELVKTPLWVHVQGVNEKVESRFLQSGKVRHCTGLGGLVQTINKQNLKNYFQHHF